MANEALSCQEAQPLLRDLTRGGLDEATRSRVAQHLATCADCKQLAEAERDLDGLLQKLPQHAAPLGLKRRLQARLPETMTAPRERRSITLARWLGPAALAVAACAVMLVLGRPPGGTMVTEAVANHLRNVYRERPIDIESGGPHQVKPWFTGRLDFALPTVFGGDDEFVLQGGSVGYYLDRKAAVLVYKCRLHSVSLLVFRADGLAFPRGERQVAGKSVSLRHERGFQVLLWQDGDLGYSLVSDLNGEDLLRLAGKVAP